MGISALAQRREPAAKDNLLHFQQGDTIFAQGETADAIFWVQHGRVTLTVIGPSGQEAILAILQPGSFLGESCLSGVTARSTTAIALTGCVLLRIDKASALRRLREDLQFCEALTRYLLARNLDYESDLCDQVFHSSEKRLARLLLRLCRFGVHENGMAVISPKLTHEALAQMVGTTRSRVTFFMNRFRKMGLIEYGRTLAVQVEPMKEFVSRDGETATVVPLGRLPRGRRGTQDGAITRAEGRDQLGGAVVAADGLEPST